MGCRCPISPTWFSPSVPLSAMVCNGGSSVSPRSPCYSITHSFHKRLLQACLPPRHAPVHPGSQGGLGNLSPGTALLMAGVLSSYHTSQRVCCKAVAGRTARLSSVPPRKLAILVEPQKCVGVWKGTSITILAPSPLLSTFPAFITQHPQHQGMKDWYPYKKEPN